MNTDILNLPEFAEEYAIPDVYGATVACLDMNQGQMEEMQKRTVTVNFYSVVLTVYGHADYEVGGRLIHTEMNDMVILPPHRMARHAGCSPRAASVHLLVEAHYFEEILQLDNNLSGTLLPGFLDSLTVYHLDESKSSELYELYRQIKKAIQQPHIYKGEMVKYYIHIAQLFLAEQIYGETVAPHDLKHKENIFKIFVHLAAQNFRKERNVAFYADKLNITPTYLSRTVREVSGNTVYGYLSSFLYNEACRLLKTTPKTISEIADDLNFSDTSALSNFFKQKSGLTPLAYRKSRQ